MIGRAQKVAEASGVALGTLYRYLGQYSDAEVALQRANYAKAEEAWKKLLEMDPDDKQAQEMLETTQMLIEALK